MFGEVYEVGWVGGWGCCRIVGENGGCRVRGMIEISVRVRTLINFKFNDACRKRIIKISEYNF